MRLAAAVDQRAQERRRAAAKRLGDLDRALEFLEQAPRIAAEYAGVVISIFVWYGLLWRPSLSSIGSAFTFVSKNLNAFFEAVWLEAVDQGWINRQIFIYL